MEHVVKLLKHYKQQLINNVTKGTVVFCWQRRTAVYWKYNGYSRLVRLEQVLFISLQKFVSLINFES